MRVLSIVQRKFRLLGLLLVVGGIAAVAGVPAMAAQSPFDSLLGSWSGSGTYTLTDGKRIAVRCNGYYTGGGSALGMVVRCIGKDSKIEMRGKLSYASGKLKGSWEERTYNAVGQASGSASPGRISLNISGVIDGHMSVSFSKNRQSVSINVKGVALKSVNVNMSR